MKSCYTIALGTILSLVSGSVRAEKIQIAYSWSLSQDAIPAPGGNQIVPVYQASGTLTAPVDSAVKTGIPGIQWNASSSPNTWPATDFNVPVNVRLTLTDVASGQSTHMDYREGFALAGTGVWYGIYQSQSISYTPPIMRWGDYLYQLYPYATAEIASVGLASTTSLPVPSSVGPTFVGAIDPFVRVSYAPGVPSPEPSTLALGGIAALGLAVGRWRRGRAGARGFLSSP